MVQSVSTTDGGRVDSFITDGTSSSGQAQHTLHIQKFDASGQAEGSEFTYSQPAPFLPVSVVALAGGGFAAAYGYAFRGYDWQVSVFDAGGHALRTFMPQAFGDGLELAASPAGGFMLAMHTSVIGAMGPDYEGPPIVQVFDNGGAQVSSTAQLSGTLPAIATSADGHYHLSWTDAAGAETADYDPQHPGDITATPAHTASPPPSPPPPPAPSSPPPTTGGEVIAGHAGGDTMTGGAGGDTITAADGANYVRGQDGDDSIVGGAGFNDINGNKGDDTIVGHSLVGDWLVGGQGNDSIAAHGHGNIVYGNIGADTLVGGAGGDIIRGGQGDDSIVAGSGTEWISGDRGDDTIQGGSGADTFNSFSGAGLDRILGFDAAKGDHVQLDPGTHYTLSQVGADTVIDLGGGDEMVLVGVNSSTLPPGWLI